MVTGTRLSVTYIARGVLILAHSVCMRPNFQGLPWFECDGLGEDELLIRYLLN